MASIQVLELRPVEAPIEDLSYDVTRNITGGFVAFVETVVSDVQDGSC